MGLVEMMEKERGQRVKEDDRVAKARAGYLTDPAKVDSYVSKFMAQQLPEGTAIQSAKHPTKIDAVNAAFTEDDPRRDLGHKIKRTFDKVISSPAFADTDPDELLPALSELYMQKYAEPTHKYTRSQQASLVGGANVKPMVGYEEWVAQQRGVEAEENEAKGSVTPLSSVPEALAFGGGFSAAHEMLARSGGGQRMVKSLAKPAAAIGLRGISKALGRGLSVAPHPLAKIAGAALIAIPEFFAFEKAMEVVGRSEWGRSKQVAGELDRVDIAEAALGLASAAAVHSGLKRGFKKALDADLVSQNAKEQLAKFPTAGNIITAHEAQRAARKAEAVLAAATEAERPALEALAAKAADEAKVAARAATIATVAPLSEQLGVAQRTVKYGVKTEAKAAKGESKKIIAELERIAAETGEAIPALESLKKEFAADELAAVIKGKEAQLLKAIKADDKKSIAAFETELNALRATADEGVENVAVNVAKQEQLREVEKQLAATSNERVKGALVQTRAKLQNDIDKIIAQNMSAMSDDATETVLKRVGKGETPLDVTSDVVATETLIAKQSAKSTDELVAEAAAKNATKAAKDEELIAKIFKAREARATAIEPAGELIERAKVAGLRTREITGKSAGQLEAAIAKRVAAEDVLVPVEPLVKRDVGEVLNPKGAFIPSTIKYNLTDNKPPFVLYLEGKLSAKEYAALQKNVNVTKAETDMVAGTAAEKKLRDVRQEVVAKTATLYDEAAETLATLTDDAIDDAFPGVGAALKLDDAALGRDISRGAVDIAEDVVAAAKPKVKRGVKKILALAGPTALGILAMDGLDPVEAEAAIGARVLGSVATFVKDSVGELTEKSLKELSAGMHIFAPPISKMAPGQKFLPPMTVTLPRMAPDVGKLEPMKEFALNRGKIMSPHYLADDLYKGHVNPMVAVLEKLTGGYHNTEATELVVHNILKGLVPEKGSFESVSIMKAISNATEPLEKKFTPLFGELGFRNQLLNDKTHGIVARIASIEKKAAKGVEGYAEDLAVMMAKKAETEAGIATAKQKLATFAAEHRAVMEPLAAKHSTVRIALATEGEKYAWVQPLLSFEEKGAVAHLKGVMQNYAARIEASGGQTIKATDYMHHAVHPRRDYDGLKRMYSSLAGDVGNAPAYSKFHSRSLGSEQLMPDIHYIMDRYLPDANKRIGLMEFWGKEGWRKHAIAASKWSPAHKQFWKVVEDSFYTAPNTTMNRIARGYTSLEVFRLLAGSPSVAAKHLIKVSASMAQFPFMTSVTTVPKALKASVRIALNRHFKNTLGRNITLTESELAIESFIKQSSYSESIADMMQGETAVGTFERFMSWANEWGSVPVRSVELYDRAFTVMAGMEMAAKKGMTVPQARHAIFKTIMNNNFIGGNQNPKWLRDPKIRAMMLFQGTPFKIAERRYMIAKNAGKSVNAAYGELLRQIKADVKEGEKRFKLGLINDALLREKDDFGKAYASTLMHETAMLGLLVVGGKEAFNVDFMNHAFHLPIVKFGGETGFATTTNPVLQSMAKAYKKQDEEDSDFFINEFAREYFRGYGAPATAIKLARLSEDDIPKMYQDARFPELSYFWGVPAVETKK